MCKQCTAVKSNNRAWHDHSKYSHLITHAGTFTLASTGEYLEESEQNLWKSSFPCQLSSYGQEMHILCFQIETLLGSFSVCTKGRPFRSLSQVSVSGNKRNWKPMCSLWYVIAMGAMGTWHFWVKHSPW